MDVSVAVLKGIETGYSLYFVCNADCRGYQPEPDVEFLSYDQDYLLLLLFAFTPPFCTSYILA